MSNRLNPDSMSGKIRTAIANNPKLPNRHIAKDVGSTSAFVAQVRAKMRKQVIKDINAFPYVPKPETPVVSVAPLKMAISMVATEEEEEAFKSLEANKQQVGGSHYKDKAIQPWDFISSNNLGFLEGNVVKYVSRWKDKNGIEDLKKAQHYLAKLIEVNS